MTYYYKENTYLQHHGILGMRWGVRNGPPYPIGVSRHSASEKRAGWRKSLDKSGKESHNRSGRTGLSDKQKKAIKVGAAVVAGTLAVAGAAYLVKTGKVQKYISRGKNIFSSVSTDSAKRIGGGIDRSLNFKTKNHLDPPEKFINHINPKYATSVDYTMNCGNCAIAFEMNCRGYDVEARGNPIGMSSTGLMQFFRGGNKNTAFSIDSINDINALDQRRGVKVKRLITKEILKRYGSDNARGAIYVQMPAGGHWINWTKRGSNIEFYNPQDPSLDLTRTYFRYAVNRPNNSEAMTRVFRLDNLDVVDTKINSMSSVVKNRGAKATTPRYQPFTELGDGFIIKDRLR